MRVTRVLRCQPPSQIEDRSEAPRISGSAGEATRPKIVATEKIVKYFTICTVLGIGTGNSSAVVSVVPSDRSSKRGALLGPKRHPNRQDRTSTGVFLLASKFSVFESVRECGATAGPKWAHKCALHFAAAWGHRGTLVGELAARTGLRGDVEVAHPATFPGFLCVPRRPRAT